MDSKGSKTRTIDLHNQARRALYNYLYYKEDYTHHDAHNPDSVYVFTSQRAAWLRQQGQSDHLTVRGIVVYLGHQTRDDLPAMAITARYPLPGRQQLKKKLPQLTG